jgi:uncharacterized protein (DUF488 family)
MASTRLLTVGHGAASEQQLATLLTGAGIRRLVDVRSFPGSRRNPHLAREALAEWLPAAGLDYGWEPDLGGRRRLQGPSPDTWWRVEAFRAYAQHMRTETFRDGFGRLAATVAQAPTAVMCSESLWWRCHRRMVADYAVAVAGWRVEHLGHNGSLTEHRLAAGARVEDALLFYDRPA